MTAHEKDESRIAIRTIKTHKYPHLDEIVAIWLLKTFGGEKYSGLDTAKLEFENGSGEQTVTDGNVTDWEKSGVLIIGTGNGRFDEHKKGAGVLAGDCAASLVAGYLGVADHPALRQILRFTLVNDRQGSSQPFDVASVIKSLYRQFPDQPEVSMNWAITAIQAKYEEQSAFFSKTAEEFKKAKIKQIDFGHKQIILAAAVSDDPQFNKYARSQGVAIIIQRDSKGHTQIFTNKKVADFRLHDIAKILRLEEQKLRETSNPVINWHDLAAEGMLANWYYQQETETLLNGCLTAPDVEPTVLSLEFITRAVEVGINPNYFHQKCPIVSSQKNCLKHSCTWYHWGLHRCCQQRYEMNHKRR